jgi:spore coat protein H
MKSDKVKKISQSISVVLAMILFFFLYLINLNIEEKANNNRDESIEAGLGTLIKNTGFKEIKRVYEGYNPGEISKVYINALPSSDEDGRIIDISAFDLISKWDSDYNPVLDANVQFVSKEKQAVEQHINVPNASFRVRGNPAASLKSYRIKFMDGVDAFHGQSVFNLNKHLNDPSRIANKLAHDLIIGLEHISSFRTSFLEVYIRDASLDKDESEFNSYGLFTHIEQPNKAYLKSRGLDEKGSLYRAEDFCFQLTPQLKNVDDSDYDKQSFETVLGIREGKNHTKLIQMLKDINDESKDFDQVFHTYFNEDNYLTWLSVNILLGNADSMFGGFLLYNPSDSSVFYLLPWDFDGIFRWMEDDTDIPNIYEQMDRVTLHRRYMEQDENVEKLKSKIEELISGTFSPKNVKFIIKNYKPVLLEMMDQYPDNVLSTIQYKEHIAYLGKIDERILMNYHEFMKQYN